MNEDLVDEDVIETITISDEDVIDDDEELDKLSKSLTLSKWAIFKRKISFFFQRRVRGWDDSSTWDLDYTAAKYLLPRLKRFKKLNNGFPFTHHYYTWDTWNETIGKMIIGFELLIKDKDGAVLTENQYKEMTEGLTLFGENYRELWW